MVGFQSWIYENEEYLFLNITLGSAQNLVLNTSTRVNMALDQIAKTNYLSDDKLNSTTTVFLEGWFWH